MTSQSSTLVRGAATLTLVGAAVFGLSACGPQSGATTAVGAAPAGTVPQQSPYPGVNSNAAVPAPQPPVYAANNGNLAPAPVNAGQAVPAPSGYAGRVPNAAAPSTQSYAPPIEVAQQAAPAPAPAPRAVSTGLRGEVSAIEPIHSRPQGSGAGAVIGGVLGAVVGNQFGHGSGRTALTVLGAGGGAVAGNNVERNVNEEVTGYRISVRLDNGQSRTYEETRLEGLRVGDRVRVEGHRLNRI